jgi:hypothetical protein
VWEKERRKREGWILPERCSSYPQEVLSAGIEGTMAMGGAGGGGEIL